MFRWHKSVWRVESRPGDTEGGGGCAVLSEDDGGELFGN